MKNDIKKFDFIKEPHSKNILYDKEYYNNLKKQHKETAEKINKKRWDFVNCIPFKVVLDYGCGCGELSKFSPKEVIVDSYDIGKLNGSPYPQTGINHEKYDLIFFNDIIEHVDWKNNPDKDIEKILKKTKYVCISIPIWEYNGDIKQWKHYKPEEHLSYFNHKEINDFFYNMGFEEIKSDWNECPPREDILSIIYKKINFSEKNNSIKTKKRKIILKQKQSPGDILTFTRAFTDFKLSYPDWDIDVRTPCPEIFENCPHLTHLNENNPEIEIYEIGYPDINISGWNGLHYTDAFKNDIENQIGVKIKKTGFKPILWISDEEKGWINQVEVEFGWKGPFWILNAGNKYDNELKKYHRWQEVVNILNTYFEGKVKIIQIGHKKHEHEILDGVFNLVGKTDLRQLIRLAYWSEGLIGPLSLQFVLAAALEKPGVVIAGGKEGVNWHIYPHIRHICVNGSIDCCKWDGCWLGGGKGKCKNLVNNTPKCFKMIKPYMIVDAIKMYYEGGILKNV
jgi:ADP-heptose:LPS heptosyltransferase